MADANHSSSGALEVEGFTPYAQIPVWVLRDPDLSLGAKALYGALMTYADNRTKLAFPGQERVAADLGCTVRTVYKYMKELEESGILSVERRRNKRTGNFYANSYVLRFADPSESTFRPAAEQAFRGTRPTNLTRPTSVSQQPPVAAAVSPVSQQPPVAAAPWDDNKSSRRRAVRLMAESLQQLEDSLKDETQCDTTTMDDLEVELGLDRIVGNDMVNTNIGEWLLGVRDDNGGGSYGAGAALNAYIRWATNQPF